MLFGAGEDAPLRFIIVARGHAQAQPLPHGLLPVVQCDGDSLGGIVDSGGAPCGAIVGGIRNVLHLGLGHCRTDSQRNGISVLEALNSEVLLLEGRSIAPRRESGSRW